MSPNGISNPPFFIGQGGHRYRWKCRGVGTDIDAGQLVSVSGLQLSASFSGEIKSAQITLVFSGPMSATSFDLALVDEMTGSSVNLARWEESARETDGTTTTITAIPHNSEKIPGDYNFFTPLAWEPRELAFEWLSAATMQAFYPVPFKPPAYTDPYNERKASRVAAPAATLAGLAGFANTTSRTGLRLGDERSSSQWGTSWTYFNDIPLTVDVQWDVTPGYAGQPSFVSNMPLYWHQAGQYWHITWTGRSKWPSVSSDKSQFPLGHTQYIALEVKCQGGSIFNPTTYLKPQDYNNPDTTQDIEITFKSRKEAKQFYKANASYLAPDSHGWGSSGYGNTGSDIKRWGGSKTVKITNVALYEGALAPFYKESRATLAPTATQITCGASECVEFGERVMQGSNAASTTRLQNMLAAASFQYVPQRMDAEWHSLGITSASALRPGYEIIQDVYPITINQLYTTRDLFAQACMLGSLSFCSLFYALDTCPESGQVFGLALTKHTVVSVSAATSYPMPRAWEISVKGPHNDDHTFTYTDKLGDGDTQSIAIMQGAFSPGQAPVKSGTHNYMAIGGELWQDNPGSLVDRWTGSSYDGSSVTFPSSQGVFHAAATSGLYWLSEDGQLWPRKPSLPTSYSAGTLYAVRDQEGQEHKLFATNGYMEHDGTPPAAGKYSQPIIDAYPLMSFLKAHARVYGDNYNRQSYNVQTTLAFASALPGDVVAVQLDQLNAGTPTLAFVLSVALSSEATPTLEIVPMHKITADDYSAYSNLNAVLP